MRLWSLVVEHAEGSPVTVTHVCSAVLRAASVDGVAVAVTLSATPRETLVARGALAADLEDLTSTLGEGPFVDAATDGPVLVADLTAAEWAGRWPVFAPAAVQLGVRAVFAIPLRVGGIRLGVLALSRASPGPLDHDQLADVLVLADTVCALLLDVTARNQPYQDGHWPEGAALQHPEVHQATGMIIVQLGVSAAVALTRLRAYSYANDRRLRHVASDVVGRRLRFAPDTDGSVDSQEVPRTTL